MVNVAVAVSLGLIVILIAAQPGSASPFDVGPVTDSRLKAKLETNTRFDPIFCRSRAAWEQRAQRLREQILTGCGLLPMPRKTPLHARVFGGIDRGEYTVEKVHFQSYPGLYVVGNLYRPKGKPGPHPAILNPHGHWEVGRFHDHERGSMAARCISLARQGFVAFTYSMVGYNEGNPINHRFHGPKYELWGISTCGLQTYNSIRAIEFLQSLPDVDPDRIGCTGSSGGGTQTFLLTAVDGRIKVSAPVCMVSAHMQGGCRCENGPLLRIDTNNVEIASLAAPRPMFIAAATGDWTDETMTVEYPAIRQVYRLYGAENKVGAWLQRADHNYNKASREAVYPWFGRFFLGDMNAAHFSEEPYEMEKVDDLLAFDNPPADALDLEGLARELISMHQEQIEGFGLRSRASLRRYRRTFGAALKRCLAVEAPAPEDVSAEERGTDDLQRFSVTRLVIRRKDAGDAIPALLFVPRSAGRNMPAALVVHSAGKAALMEGKSPGALVNRFLENGNAVLAIDCFLTGDADRQDERLKTDFFTTFYRSDAAQRVQDVLTAAAYLRSRGEIGDISLIGLRKAGLWCLFARAFAPWVSATVIDAGGFDPTSDEAFLTDFFVPVIRRVGDVRTAATQIAPGRLAIFNAGAGWPVDWMQRAYQAAGSAGNLRITASGLSTGETADMCR